MAANPYEALQIERYFNVAGAVILVYDHMITLEWEAYYYVQSRWGLPKIVFIVCRYLPYPGVIMAAQEAALSYVNGDPLPHVECTVLDVISFRGNILRVCSVVFAEVLLSVRIWILWEKSKRMFIILVGLAVVTLPISLYLNMDPVPVVNRLGYFCADQVSQDASVVSGAIIAYELSLLSLVLIRWRKLRGTVGEKSIANVLVRECILYIMFIVGISSSIVIVGFAFPEEYSAMFEALQITIHTGMACRTMLNLVRNEKEVEEPTIIDELDDMAFAAPASSGLNVEAPVN